MKRTLTFILILYLSTSNILAQKDTIESIFQTRLEFEQRTKEMVDDFNTYLREFAGGTWRTSYNERILALKYLKTALELCFARKGETFNIQGVEYKPMITLIDKTGKIVKRLSPKRFCEQIMNGYRIPPKFVWCNMRIACFSKEHCKQISSSEYIIDAVADTNYEKHPIHSPIWDERKLKEIKIMAERLMADTSKGTKEWLEPRFIDLYAIIPE